MPNPSYSPIGNSTKRQKTDDALDNVDLSDDDLDNNNDDDGMPNADIERLSLPSLKSETVRLEYEAARIQTHLTRIQTRLTLAKSRITQITSLHRSNATFHQGSTNPPQRRQRGTRPDRIRCMAAGCTSNAQKKGLCERHGEYIGKRCSYKGCTNHVKNNGLCYRHGATIKLCGVEGCSNRVQRKGVCYKHGARLEVVTCSVRSCRNVAKVGGLCKKHRDTMGNNTNSNTYTNPEQMVTMMGVVNVPAPEDVCQVVPTDVATTCALTTGGVDDDNQQPDLPEGEEFETKRFSIRRDDQCR